MIVASLCVLPAVWHLSLLHLSLWRPDWHVLWSWVLQILLGGVRPLIPVCTCMCSYFLPYWLFSFVVFRFLNIKIQEGDAHNIFCPAYECYQLVPVHVIESVVSREMDQRYLQFDIKVETSCSAYWNHRIKGKIFFYVQFVFVFKVLCILFLSAFQHSSLCFFFNLLRMLYCRPSWKTTHPSAGVPRLAVSERWGSPDRALETATPTASPCCHPQLSTAARVTCSAGKHHDLLLYRHG